MLNGLSRTTVSPFVGMFRHSPDNATYDVAFVTSAAPSAESVREYESYQSYS